MSLSKYALLQNNIRKRNVQAKREKQRSSLKEMFCEKGFLNFFFTKLIEKQLCQSLFLIKLQAWGLVGDLSKCIFSENFAKFLRTPFFIKQLRWLLLKPEIIKRKNTNLLTYSWLFLLNIFNKIFRLFWWIVKPQLHILIYFY